VVNVDLLQRLHRGLLVGTNAGGRVSATWDHVNSPSVPGMSPALDGRRDVIWGDDVKCCAERSKNGEPQGRIFP
jgi:hypothetical protein